MRVDFRCEYSGISERRLACQTPRRIAHTHASWHALNVPQRAGKRLEAGNNFAHLPQSGFNFELSEAEERESKKESVQKREGKGEWLRRQIK